MRTRTSIFRGILAACLIFGLAAPALAGDCNEIEPQELIQILGDDAVEVEVNLSGALLGIVGMAAKEDLGEDTHLDSIDVLIFDLSRVKGGDRQDRIDQAGEALAELQRRLKRRGWERMARVREDGNDLTIMIQADGEMIGGMAVLGMDREDGDEGNVMLITLCGVLDMAALAEVADNLDIDLPEID